MNTLSIDIETFSDVDLRKCGVYRYTDSPNFDILLFAYSIDEGPVQLIDLASGEKIPEEITEAILSEDTIKTAFNANFERVALMRYLSRKSGQAVYLDPSSWRCSEVQAAMLGLPLHLEGVAKVLRLDAQKMSEGKPLIRYFCIPCKPTAANGGRTRNLPSDAPDKWELFKQYNIRDVEVELEIRKKIKDYPIPESEQALYELDQRINDRGFRADMDFVMQSIFCDRQFTVSATERAYELTGLENPNSVSQLKDWLSDRGVEVESLSKKNVKELVSETDGEVEEALKLRLLMAKTSVRKYEAIERAVCSDGRVHGLFQFYGANRTGRFAGRLVQVQNLPQNHLKDLRLARDLVKESRFDDLQMLFGNTPGVLSELIRTAFIPKEGHRFIVADFSSVERVVLAWIAHEKWVIDAFSQKKDLYSATASRMFHIPLEQIDKKSSLRQKGKITDLACIAEGQLVMTNRGLKPIESVTTADMIWDGEGWVAHGGLVFRGEKETVCVDGVICTPDHLILTNKGWIESGRSSGLNWAEVRSPYSTIPNCKQLSWKGNVDVPMRLRLGKSIRILQPITRKHKFLWLLYGGSQYGTRIRRKKGFFKNASFLPGLGRHEEPMLFTKKSLLAYIWRAWNHGMQKMAKFREIQGRYVANIQNGHDIRSHKWKRELCSEQLPLGYNKAEQSKSTQCKTLYHTLGRAVCTGDSRKSRLHESLYTCTNKERGSWRKIMAPSQAGIKWVYDLLNCGKRHRFTVWNGYRLCIVHNCGYGGGVGALKSMGALEMGVEEHELQGLIDNWRRANPNIVNFWWEVDKAAITAVKERTRTRTHGIIFIYKSGMLFITLPSGRDLVYVKPKLMLNQFGREGLTYEGIGTTKKWERIETYGPKIVENIVQAVARDLLAEAMLRLDKSGFSIVAHVHDEVICEVAIGQSSVDEVCGIMTESPKWSEGLPLDADGFECDFYRKD